MTIQSPDTDTENVQFKGEQDGVQVFTVEGPAAKAMSTAEHYAGQYADEGPVEVYRKVDGNWLLWKVVG